ncbi:MAG: hypothetical protein CM1200mP22_10700 [Dehalococcoidia bacterium]|nr:MAG: hypothetical protein CM1200mP22_10700 [Dehalococcoidia bacterium]
MILKMQHLLDCLLWAVDQVGKIRSRAWNMVESGGVRMNGLCPVLLTLSSICATTVTFHLRLRQLMNHPALSSSTLITRSRQ